MRQVALLFLVVAGVASVAAAVPFVGGDKEYNLGSVPQVGRTYEFDDELGTFTVKSYREQDETLSLQFSSGAARLEPDTQAQSEAMVCELGVPVDLVPSGACAFKVLRADKHREYRLEVRWGYKVKKGIRYVEVRVMKKVLKLD